MARARVYTIGHSNHTADALIALLKQHGVTLVVDVRSQPYSRWASQFNRETLLAALQLAGLRYRFMGDALGGRPADPDLYHPGEERPDYERLAQTAPYQGGIEQVLAWAAQETVAIMCSEADHEHCHRHLLIAPSLAAREVEVLHIQPDGSTVGERPRAMQLSLFG